MACTAAEHKMEELYAAIEKKIKASGYPREISGADVYDDRGKRERKLYSAVQV